ncbi:nucleoside triphosphate pyrophosphohydrolase [Paraliobacillus zengyii]|uniref:nucleoside triphosphate pyrophosphohydrolase n=1 Tax=Paraliobacillus zengyii TaxID=2213194 RepID=UPI000DD2F61B|nr:nucleoside triphosphate pyrophosphohydrolase [Paraliobacillus zengyii]
MKTYNKLVRDKIPDLISRNGQMCKVKKLDQVEYYRELRTKLKEELNEYLETENDEEAIEELSDVLEIIHALSKIHGKEFKDIERIRQKKLEERGGFNEQIYLINVEELS